MSYQPIIRAVGLGKKYKVRSSESYLALRDRLALLFTRPWRVFQPTRRDTFWALRNITFEIEKGEVIGIIGRNGAGKSTLLKILSRITEPTEGYAVLRGRVGSLLEVGTGFHAELTGRENIYFNGILLGMTRQEIRKKFDEIVAFAGVEEFLDMPLKHYSSGMATRLAFSVAAHLEPEILIVDEVLAVGDIEFQKKCLNKMEEVSQRAGRTVLFVSHQMNQIRRLCNRVIWLDGGQVRMIGPTLEVVAEYEKAMIGGGENGITLQRPAHQKAYFTRWWIEQPSGDLYRLTTFEQVRLNFELVVNHTLRTLTHSIALMTMDGKILWGTYTIANKVSPATYVISYDFPMLPLPTGTYLWRVNLYDDTGLVDAWDSVPLMEVELPNYQHFSDYWGGVMNLPHTKQWHKAMYETNSTDINIAG